ncbi:TRAP transporter substrate-binding protein DctP [Arthrobacter sp. APC 3897]|uniref:TRAP transporter substrate-binding protein DctP n=1 Tax=Arthrobacter sp. APC 3897 TaxID=3035204 RepID=UPI0025B5FB08|nr:TRAP transporter substrate-binding protein DctP [Arthrobacter sp. APC 3897]MDN3480653.1 TRAP transporter substrate-binding protein DctP [Arthrobacter sp. APC 3897]
MKARSALPALPRLTTLIAGVSILSLALTACAGSAGGNGAGSNGSVDTAGFEFGASQEVIDKALADLDPVTITYQPAAASPDSTLAPFVTGFKEIIEERSGGKIKVDIVYGQAIAGYGEVHDALADGRLDMAYTLPIYEPEEFPAFNDLATVMAALPNSPFQQELINYVMGAELGWNNESIIQGYTDKNLVPLTPLAARGIFYPICSTPVTSLGDLKGKQARIGSAAQGKQLNALGGSPVSLEYAETYEALQRGTVDCTMFQLVAAVESGFLEVAPNIGHTTTSTFASAPGAVLAGSSFQNFPLPYQQLIFDANLESALGGMETIMKGKAEAIQQAKAAGGKISAFDNEVLKSLEDQSKVLTEEAVANGLLDENTLNTISESQSHWEETFEALGYVDEGSLEELDKWYDKNTDFKPYVDAAIEQGTALEHRPN